MKPYIQLGLFQVKNLLTSKEFPLWAQTKKYSVKF